MQKNENGIKQMLIDNYKKETSNDKQIKKQARQQEQKETRKKVKSIIRENLKGLQKKRVRR